MKTLSRMDSRVIGLKLAGLSVSPFLCIIKLYKRFSIQMGQHRMTRSHELSRLNRNVNMDSA